MCASLQGNTPSGNGRFAINDFSIGLLYTPSVSAPLCWVARCSRLRGNLWPPLSSLPNLLSFLSFFSCFSIRLWFLLEMSTWYWMLSHCSYNTSYKLQVTQAVLSVTSQASFSFEVRKAFTMLGTWREIEMYRSTWAISGWMQFLTPPMTFTYLRRSRVWVLDFRSELLVRHTKQTNKNRPKQVSTWKTQMWQLWRQRGGSKWQLVVNDHMLLGLEIMQHTLSVWTSCRMSLIWKSCSCLESLSLS